MQRTTKAHADVVTNEQSKYDDLNKKAKNIKSIIWRVVAGFLYSILLIYTYIKVKSRKNIFSVKLFLKHLFL